MRTLLSLLCLLLALAQSAFCLAADFDRNAVVRISAGNYGGTGTLIATDGAQGLYLTCAHVTEGGKPYKVSYPSLKKQLDATLVDEHRRIDVAVLLAPAAEGVQPIQLDVAYQQVGQRVSHGGYGRNRHDWGVLHGYQVTGSTTPDLMEVSGPSISGDSGGPIISAGKLVGVLRGGPLDRVGGKMLATQGAGGPAIGWLLERKTFKSYPWAK